MDVADTLLLDNEPFDVSRAAAWLDSLLEGAGLPPRVIAALQVVLDEVLNNIMVYGYADLETHKIELRSTADNAAVTLEFFDDGIPFDPTQRQSSVAAGDNAKAGPGGLGLLFVRRLMDEVTYERLGDRNHLTLRKFLSS
jgi:anti-sigma regulatory factor (Ser/Thr protein kinase)